MAEKTVIEGTKQVTLSNQAVATIRYRGGYNTTTKAVATPDKTVEITCPLDMVEETLPIFTQTLQDVDVILKNDIKNNGYTVCSSAE